MRVNHIILYSALAAVVLGHGNNDVNPDANYLEEKYSLIDLVHQTSDSVTSNNNWQINENVEFKEGRFILTPKPEVTSSDDEVKNLIGALWSQNTVTFGSSSGFTFETTMRSLGATGKTGAGLSFWFIRDSDKSLTNFGGPSFFDGLQILFTEDTVKSFLSDGSKEANSLKPFSTCFLAFQDSDVPITLRLSYSDKEPFKLALNNYLCFETEEVKFDDLKDFKIGITATSPNDLTKFEQYELFKFETYKKVTDEAIRENKGTLASQPRVVTKIITTDTSKPTSSQQMFLEREKKLRESIKIHKPLDNAEVLAALNLMESSNLEVLNKLNTLQSLFSTIDTHGSKSGDSKLDNDFIIQSLNNHGELKALIVQNSESLKELVTKNEETTKLVSELVSTLEHRISTLEEKLAKTHNLLDVVSSKIGSVTNDRHFNSIIAKLNEVDQNNKSILDAAKNDDPLVSLQTKIKWVIIVVFLCFAGTGFAVYRLKGEIKHGKIL